MSDDKNTMDHNNDSNLEENSDAAGAEVSGNVVNTPDKKTKKPTGKEKENTTEEVTPESNEKVNSKTDSEVNSKSSSMVNNDSDIDTIGTTDSDKDSKGTTDSANASSTDSMIDATAAKKKSKINKYKILRYIFTAGFFIFTYLFINDLFIQPYLTNKSLKQIDELYVQPSLSPTDLPLTEGVTPTSVPSISATVTLAAEVSVVVQDPNRDEKGRLKQFSKLLDTNEDVKGWITVPGTNIDYVVLQSSKDKPEYYLTRDINKKKLKAGSLFLDYKSSVEEGTQNLVIHGHNMTSTDNMFHHLLDFKELDFYKANPVFTFDSILQTGQWKIFSIFITNGTSEKESLFNYTRAKFSDSSDFLNFVYQLRIRSIFNIDDVDINENDEILTLSTCSYEVKEYRTVIVARKIRVGENANVDVESVTENPYTLYPKTYYYRYGGKAPKFTASFEVALEDGDIKWYNPMGNSIN